MWFRVSKVGFERTHSSPEAAPRPINTLVSQASEESSNRATFLSASANRSGLQPTLNITKPLQTSHRLNMHATGIDAPIQPLNGAQVSSKRKFCRKHLTTEGQVAASLRAGHHTVRLRGRRTIATLCAASCTGFLHSSSTTHINVPGFRESQERIRENGKG